jgi:hypothetical protein
MTTTTTYSIEEYAAALLGPGPDGTAATVEPSKIQWLTKRLRGEAEPALPGYKVARRWRATQADVDAAIEMLRPKRVQIPEVPSFAGMTRTSRRRLSA